MQAIINSNSRSWHAFLLACFLALSSLCRAESPVSLEKVVEKTVINNPEVQNKYHLFKAAQEEQNAARGGFYPRVDLVGTVRSQERLLPNFSNTETPNSQTQLVLRQMLFDGFATRSEVNRLGHAARVRYYELQSAMQNSALEITKAYLDVQRYRQLVGYAKENYVAHKQLFDRIEEGVTAGVRRRVDLEQANGRLALAEANLLTESTNLHDVTARYQRIAGELPPEQMAEVDFSKGGISSSVTQALSQGYQKNPDLLAAIENIVATQQEVEARRARYMPRLDLLARKNLTTSSNGENSLVAADVIELTATFNLFNGLSDKANIDQSLQKLNASQDLRDKACVDMRQTLVVAYNDIIRLKEQLTYRDQHQLSIEKAREAYRKQFDIGQRTLLDLLDTENEYFQARRTYTNTEKDFYAAHARTYAAQGLLLSQLGVSRGDLPDVNQEPYMDTQKVCEVVVPEQLQFDKVDLLAKARPLNPTSIEKTLAKSESKPVPDPTAKDRDLLLARVNSWAEAWRAKDADKFLAFYSTQFIPEGRANKKQWEAQRRKRFASTDAITLQLDNLETTIAGNQAQVSFRQQFESGRYRDEVQKTLHFARENGVWMIVAERVVKKTSVVTNSGADWQTEVASRVTAWANAWKNKDLQSYMSYYSPHFQPKKIASREAWIQQRKLRLSEAQGDIKLKLDGIRLNGHDELAVASFTQHYHSPKYSDVMQKKLRLELALEDGQWMIVRETNR